MNYLSAEAIRSSLETKIIGKQIEIQKKIPSTNDLAWEHAKAGKEEGLVVFAEEQTQGRGRQGSRWVAPRASSILLSILLRPPAVSSAPALTIGAALAVCRACETNARIRCKVKWPNDVMIDGKKVAGILAESRSSGKEPPVYVLGVGLNVNLSKPAFKDLRDIAVSLRSVTKKMYDRNPIAASFLNEFDQNYVLIRERHWSGLEVEFFERLGLADQMIEVKTPNRTHRGLFRALSIDQGVTLESEKGRHNVPCEHISSISAAKK